MPDRHSPVWSWNEWDPLEEVIVGRVEGSHIPPADPYLRAIARPDVLPLYAQWGGQPVVPELVEAAARQLDGLARLLEAEGVRVRRPEVLDGSRGFSTPDWRITAGVGAGNARDLLLVVGDEIIECPTSWRVRAHEVDAYRPLLREYARGGARWTAAPRPMLEDALYVPDHVPPKPGEAVRTVLTEHEPVFDAADFVRCGYDLFALRSNTTNRFGIDWLARHLGERFRIHEVESTAPMPMHIDTTLLPLAPGKVLVNQERLRRLPDALATWDVLVAPPPRLRPDTQLAFTSPWLTMNVLVLDGERVVVDDYQDELIALLRDHGFRPIPCPIQHFYPFGGGIHCATLDVRRSGEPTSGTPVGSAPAAPGG